MKKKTAYLFVAIILSVFSLAGCKKSEEAASSFTWKFKGTTYTAAYIKMSSIEDLGPNIIGDLGTATTLAGGVSLKLIPLVAGTYNLDASFQFMDTEGFVYNGIGQIVVSQVRDGKLSATITANVSGPSGPHPLSVTIINIPITN